MQFLSGHLNSSKSLFEILIYILTFLKLNLRRLSNQRIKYDRLSQDICQEGESLEGAGKVKNLQNQGSGGTHGQSIWSQSNFITILLQKIKEVPRISQSQFIKDCIELFSLENNLIKLENTIRNDLQNREDCNSILKNNFKDIKKIFERICVMIKRIKDGEFYEGTYDSIADLGFEFIGIGVNDLLKQFLTAILEKYSFLENFIYLKINDRNSAYSITKIQDREILDLIKSTYSSIDEGTVQVLAQQFGDKGTWMAEELNIFYCSDMEDRQSRVIVDDILERIMNIRIGVSKDGDLSDLEEEIFTNFSQKFIKIEKKQLKRRISLLFLETGLLNILSELIVTSRKQDEPNYLHQELLYSLSFQILDKISKKDLRFVLYLQSSLSSTSKLSIKYLIKNLFSKFGYSPKNVKSIIEEKHKKNLHCYGERVSWNKKNEFFNLTSNLPSCSSPFDLVKMLKEMAGILRYFGIIFDENLAQFIQLKFFSFLMFFITIVKDYFRSEHLKSQMDIFYIHSVKQLILELLNSSLKLIITKKRKLNELNPEQVLVNQDLVKVFLEILEVFNSIKKNSIQEIQGQNLDSQSFDSKGKSLICSIEEVSLRIFEYMELSGSLFIGSGPLKTILSQIKSSQQPQTMLKMINHIFERAQHSLSNFGPLDYLIFAKPEQKKGQILHLFGLTDQENFLGNQSIDSFSPDLQVMSTFNNIIKWILEQDGQLEFHLEVQKEFLNFMKNIIKLRNLNIIEQLYNSLVSWANYFSSQIVEESFENSTQKIHTSKMLITILKFFEFLIKLPLFKIYAIENGFSKKFLLGKLKSVKITEFDDTQFHLLVKIINIYDILLTPKYGLNACQKKKLKLNYIIEDIPPESHIQNFVKELSKSILKLAEDGYFKDFGENSESKNSQILLKGWIKLLDTLADNALGVSTILYSDYSRSVKRKPNPIISLKFELEVMLSSFTKDRLNNLDVLVSMLKLLFKLGYDSSDKKYQMTVNRKEAICTLIFGKRNASKIQETIIPFLGEIDKNLENQHDILAKILLLLEREIEPLKMNVIEQSKLTQPDSESLKLKDISIKILKFELLISQLSKWINKDEDSIPDKKNPDLGMPRDLDTRLSEIEENGKKQKKDFSKKIYKQISNLTSIQSFTDFTHRVRVKISDLGSNYPPTSNLNLRNEEILNESTKKSKSFSIAKIENEMNQELNHKYPIMNKEAIKKEIEHKENGDLKFEHERITLKDEINNKIDEIQQKIEEDLSQICQYEIIDENGHHKEVRSSFDEDNLLLDAEGDEGKESLSKIIDFGIGIVPMKILDLEHQLDKKVDFKRNYLVESLFKDHKSLKSPMFQSKFSEKKKRNFQQNLLLSRNMIRNYGSRTPSLHVDEFQAQKNAPIYPNMGQGLEPILKNSSSLEDYSSSKKGSSRNHQVLPNHMGASGISSSKKSGKRSEKEYSRDKKSSKRERKTSRSQEGLQSNPNPQNDYQDSNYKSHHNKSRNKGYQQSHHKSHKKQAISNTSSHNDSSLPSSINKNTSKNSNGSNRNSKKSKDKNKKSQSYMESENGSGRNERYSFKAASAINASGQLQNPGILAVSHGVQPVPNKVAVLHNQKQATNLVKRVPSQYNLQSQYLARVPPQKIGQFNTPNPGLTHRDIHGQIIVNHHQVHTHLNPRQQPPLVAHPSQYQLKHGQPTLLPQHGGVYPHAGNQNLAQPLQIARYQQLGQQSLPIPNFKEGSTLQTTPTPQLQQGGYMVPGGVQYSPHQSLNPSQIQQDLIARQQWQEQQQRHLQRHPPNLTPPIDPVSDQRQIPNPGPQNLDPSGNQKQHLNYFMYQKPPY